MSFGVAFTAAFLILASTLGTVLVTAKMVDAGIKPSLSWITSMFAKPKSYEEIEKASRALPDGYVSGVQINCMYLDDEFDFVASCFCVL